MSHLLNLKNMMLISHKINLLCQEAWNSIDSVGQHGKDGNLSNSTVIQL